MSHVVDLSLVIMVNRLGCSYSRTWLSCSFDNVVDSIFILIANIEFIISFDPVSRTRNSLNFVLILLRLWSEHDNLVASGKMVAKVLLNCFSPSISTAYNDVRDY